MTRVDRAIGDTAVVAVIVALASLALTSRAAAESERSFEIYGFAMTDYIQDTKRVDPAWQDAFRPSKIGIDGQFGTDGQTSVSVKQSRFGVKGSLPTGDSLSPINFKFEIDFFGTGADAGQTTIRLRHFYAEWGQFLAGQTHTLFMDIDTFPNTIDYWGPPGMVFWRHPQFRWTGYRTEKSEFAIAIEGPSNDIDPGNIRETAGFENAQTQADEKVPDFTAHYRLDDSWGHVQIAGILRRVGFEYRVNPTDPWRKGSQTGWGVNLSGAWKFLEKDQLLVSVVHGDGIASYMNDGGMDLAPNAVFNPGTTTPSSLSSEAVPLTGVTAYVDHYWNSKWSSSIGYSFTKVTNTNYQAPGTFHKGDYASVNLLAYPTERLMVGAELLWGKLTTNTNTTGDDVRFQFSAKYTFGTKL